MATFLGGPLSDPTGANRERALTARFARQAAAGQAKANAANQARFNAAKNAIGQGIREADAFGQVEREAVDRNLAKDLADAQQSTSSRGLYNTTILDSLKAGAKEDAGFQTRDIAQKQAMLKMEQYNKLADLNARPAAQAPDAMSYGNLAAQAGQYAVPGTISSAVAASNAAAPGLRKAPVSAAIPKAGVNPYQQYRYPIGPQNKPKRDWTGVSNAGEVQQLMSGIPGYYY